MSQPRGFGLNGKSIYANICKPMLVTCNFVVDSTNGNQLGVRSIKSNGYVEKVFMGTQAGAPAGTPAFGTARDFAILGATAVTSSGSSVLTGQLGIFPGTSITGVPPATVSGAVHVADVAASNAKASAQATYTALQALSPTTVATALDGQTLTPGVYKAVSGTFTIDAAGGPLVLNGAGVYVFQTTTTLITGTTGAATITLQGGARAQDVYWVVGSSATLSSGTASAHKGNVIALTSITSTTTAGSVAGSLVALNGAVTLSAATTVVATPLAPVITSGSPNPMSGFCWVQFKNSFNKYLGGFSGFVSPISGTPVAVGGSALKVGQAYIIVRTGTTSAAEWATVGLPAGLTAAVGQSFIALATGAGAGSGLVEVPAVSGINSVEVVGDPNLSLAPAQIGTNGGSWVLLQFLSNGLPAAPVDGSVVGMTFLFDGSTVTIDGI